MWDDEESACEEEAAARRESPAPSAPPRERYFAKNAPSWEGEPSHRDVCAEIVAVAAEAGATMDREACEAVARIVQAIVRGSPQVSALTREMADAAAFGYAQHWAHKDDVSRHLDRMVWPTREAAQADLDRVIAAYGWRGWTCEIVPLISFPGRTPEGPRSTGENDE